MCISALGIAVSPAVTVAEILKSRQLATEKQIHTTLTSVGDPPRSRQKPEINIVLVKSPTFDEVVAAESQLQSSTNEPIASGVSSSAIAQPFNATSDGQIGSSAQHHGASETAPLISTPLADTAFHGGLLADSSTADGLWQSGGSPNSKSNSDQEEH